MPCKSFSNKFLFLISVYCTLYFTLIQHLLMLKFSIHGSFKKNAKEPKYTPLFLMAGQFFYDVLVARKC